MKTYYIINLKKVLSTSISIIAIFFTLISIIDINNLSDLRFHISVMWLLMAILTKDKYYVIKEMLSDSNTILCIMKFNDPNSAMLYARYLNNQDVMCVQAIHSVAEYQDVDINDFPIKDAKRYINDFSVNNKELIKKRYISYE